MSQSAEDTQNSALEFLGAQSESAVYKEFGDIRECLPPDLSIERVASAGNLLRSIYSEAVSPLTLDPCRIFWIREKPLVEACDGQSEDVMEDAKILADYALLPKILVELIDQHRACRRVLSASPLSDAQLRAERDSGRKFFDLLRAQPELDALVSSALSAVQQVVARLHWPMEYACPFQSEEDFFRGLLGAEVDASTQDAKQAMALCCGFLFSKRKLPALGNRLPPRREWREHASNQNTLRSLACISAALGRLDVLKRLRRRPLRYRTAGYHVTEAAAIFQHFHILEWASRVNAAHFRSCDAVLTGAAFQGAEGLAVAKWWFEAKKLPPPENFHGSYGFPILATAAMHGAAPIPFISYLRSKGCEWQWGVDSNRYLNYIARRGTFDVFRYVNEDIGAPTFPEWVLEDALKGRSMEIVLYALQNGASWTRPQRRWTSALGIACKAFEGDTSILTQLVTLGVPADEPAVKGLCRQAVEGHYLAMLEAFVPTLAGFSSWQDLAKVIVGAALESDSNEALEAVRWLVKQEGVHPLLITAAEFENHGEIRTETPLLRAIQLSNLEAVKLICDYKIGFELARDFPRARYVTEALESGPASKEILRLLFSQGFYMGEDGWLRCFQWQEGGRDASFHAMLIEDCGLDFSLCKESYVAAAMMIDEVGPLEYAWEKKLFEEGELLAAIVHDMCCGVFVADTPKVAQWALCVDADGFKTALLAHSRSHGRLDSDSTFYRYLMWAEVESERDAITKRQGGAGGAGAGGSPSGKS